MPATLTRSNAIVTTDRSGVRVYVWPHGASISRDGCGRTPWTVYYGPKQPEDDYGMTDTLAEALAWANLDLEGK